MTVQKLLLNALEQFVSLVGIVFIAGFIISLFNRMFYSLVGNSRAVLYSTSFIGTPIHELSHAVMCILFGHKILEIKLFQMDSDDGTLGYVKHSSNPRNLYQQLGGYFIGVAPILVSSVVLYFAMQNFIPETYKVIGQVFNKLGSGKAFAWIANFDDYFVKIMKSLFSNMGDSIYSWIFIILSMCIALHMNLSRADLKGALRSLPLVAILLAAVNLILGLVSRSAYSKFVAVMSKASLFLALMLSLALIISALYVILAFIVRQILSLVLRR